MLLEIAKASRTHTGAIVKTIRLVTGRLQETLLTGYFRAPTSLILRSEEEGCGEGEGGRKSEEAGKEEKGKGGWRMRMRLREKEE